jgi:hypothetical protein
MVWPTVATAVVVLLTMLRLALALTTNVAVAGFVFEPTEVANDPAGMVLGGIPPVTLVTTAETVQLPPGGIPVPCGTSKLAADAVAKGDVLTIHEVATSDAEALNKPVGYASIKFVVNVAVLS